MKFVRFSENGSISYGILEGEKVIKIKGAIFEEYKLTDDYLPLTAIKILEPIIPEKFIGVGLNYREHAKEVNKSIPKEPRLFTSLSSAIIGTEEKIKLVYPEHRIEHEGELAIIIGKTAKNVSVTDALDYVFGYTCANDISDRTLQKLHGSSKAKTFPTYKPMGPIIETEIEPNQVQIQVRVNGEVKQNSNTSDMIFNISEIISYISQKDTLLPGDVIMTGTPSGVSSLKNGDVVEVEIEGIGILRNKVTLRK